MTRSDKPLRSSTRLTAGVLFDGTYRIVSQIGRGGMGTVYRALDKSMGREVALKVLHPQTLSPRQRQRFEREGQVTAALEHPGIVRVHGYGELGDRPYLVYELVEDCRTLEDLMRELGLQTKVGLIRDAAAALGYAHQRGVVHRDVKPANLLVDPNRRLRIADFGLALTESADRLTRPGELVGTPTYMAPEQVSGRVGGESPATDVWALGVVLYEALTGILPFEAKSLMGLTHEIRDADPRSPRSIVPDVPRALEQVCLRALEKDPDNRYADASALAESLDAALAGESLTPQPNGRSRAGVALLICLAVGGGAWAVTGSDGPDPPLPRPGSTKLAPADLVDVPLPEVPLRRAMSLRDPRERLDALQGWLAVGDRCPDRETVLAAWRRTRLLVPLSTRRTEKQESPHKQRPLFIDHSHFVVSGDPDSVWGLGADGAATRLGNLDPAAGIAALRGRAVDTWAALYLPPDSPSWLLRGQQGVSLLIDGGPSPTPQPMRDVRLDLPLKKRATFLDLGQEQGLLVSWNHPTGEGLELVVHSISGTDSAELTRARLPYGSMNMALSPSGRWLATVSASDENDAHHLTVLDLEASGELAWTFEQPSTPSALVFSSRSDRLVLTARGGIAFLFDPAGDGTPIQLVAKDLSEEEMLLRGMSGRAPLRAGIFSPDGAALLTTACRTDGSKRELRCWNALTGEELEAWRLLEFPTAPMWTVQAPSGLLVFGSGEQISIHEWAWATD